MFDFRLNFVKITINNNEADRDKHSKYDSKFECVTLSH